MAPVHTSTLQLSTCNFKSALCAVGAWHKAYQFICCSLIVVSSFVLTMQTAHSQDNSVSTLILDVQGMPAVIDRARNVVLGDLDLDGDLDAIIGVESSQDRILINDNGNFSNASLNRELDSVVFSHVGDLALGDIDNDGDLDLIVGNYTDSDATPGVNRVYKNMTRENNGQFSFELFFELPINGDRPTYPPTPILADDSGAERGDRTKAVAVSDFDLDGDLDLAVGNENVPNRLYINDGTGILTEQVSWRPEPAKTEAMAWGDVDNDRDPDLIVGNLGEPSQLYINQGGTLVLSGWSPPLGNVRSVLWVDINTDSQLDLVIGYENYPDQIFLNRGGSFLDSADYIFPENLETNSIDAGDIDNDGDLDLAIGIRSRAEPNRLYINQTAPNSYLVSLVQVGAFGISEPTRDLTWGDVDNDGNLDLIVINQDAQDRFYRNDRTVLQPISNQQWSSSGESAVDVEWGDYDGDGDLDLGVANADGSVEVYRNSSGLLQSEPQWRGRPNSSASSLTWGDFNNDGFSDLAIGNSDPLESNVIYMSDDQSRFTSLLWNPTPQPTVDLAWGDADGDGDLDLAVANNGASNQYFINQNGTLIRAPWLPPVQNSTAIAWVDVDGANGLDIAVGTVSGQPLQIYLNNGDGTFQDEPQYSSQSKDDTRAIAWGDYDGDGDPDLAVANGANADRLYINESTDGINPKLNETFLHSGSRDSLDLAWTDIDNDQDLELLVVGEQTSYLYIFNGQESKQYEPKLLTPSGISSMAWGDYDLDGDPDLVFGRSGPSIQLWENRYVSPGTNLSGLEVELDSIELPSDGSITTLPISYTLFSALGLPVSQLRAEYLDENGEWQAAIAYTDTVTSGLSTARFIGATQGNVTNETELPNSDYSLHIPLVMASREFEYVAQPIEHVYTWDLAATGVTGNREDVVVRFILTPGCLNSCQRASISVQTQPLSLRGNTIRVLRQLSDGDVEPARQAMIYRASGGSGGSDSFEPLADSDGRLLRTDGNGYLVGNPTILPNDRLIAYAPITVTTPLSGFITITDTTNYVEQYWSSAIETGADGLQSHVVESFGQQTLTVTQDSQFVLFNLTLSLEWDGRNEPAYQAGGTLEQDLKRASSILYDATDGQAAIGEVHVFFDKGHWGEVNIAVSARNTQRPSAMLGGYVLTRTTEIVNGTSIEYVPGQIRMPPTWNKFGDPEQGRTGDDWAQVLAHELGHYLFGIPDNYLGFKNGNILTLVDCAGSIMTDPFSPDYSEFLNRSGWDSSPDCGLTIAANRLGRTDWDSIRRWYPNLDDTRQNAGPTTLPLAVTEVSFFYPEHQSSTIDEVEYFLVDENGGSIAIPDGYGQAYLLRGNRDGGADDSQPFDAILDLGRPVNNRISARGASPQDRLCVSDSSSGILLQGCRAISASGQTITLMPYVDWLPNVRITPLSTNTVSLLVTGIVNQAVEAQMIPAIGAPSTPVPLTTDPLGLVATLSTEDAAFFGYVRLCSPSCPSSNSASNVDVVETIIEFTNIESWEARGYGWGARGYGWGARGYGWGARGYGWGARGYGWGVQGYGWGARGYGWGAPVLSSDGQVSVFPPEDIFNVGTEYYLQRLDFLPSIPMWLSPVGQAYRFDAETSPADASILFQYLGTDVPPKAESSLAIYYSADEGATWSALTTEQNATWNLASALMPGLGIYVLAATQAVEPPLQPTCNAGLGYSMVTARPVWEALSSIEGSYSSVYAYDSTTPDGGSEPTGWLLYDTTVEEPFTDTVNSLVNMELNGTYYIYVTSTEPVTVSIPFDLEGAELAVEPAVVHGSIPTPATYYGWITPTVGFTPTLGMTVVATINGSEAGTTEVIELDGKLAYVIQVDPASVRDCGPTTNEIVFSVGGQVMDHNRGWDNSRAHFHPLSAVVP